MLQKPKLPHSPNEGTSAVASSQPSALRCPPIHPEGCHPPVGGGCLIYWRKTLKTNLEKKIWMAKWTDWATRYCECPTFATYYDLMLAETEVRAYYSWCDCVMCQTGFGGRTPFHDETATQIILTLIADEATRVYHETRDITPYTNIIFFIDETTQYIGRSSWSFTN